MADPENHFIGTLDDEEARLIRGLLTRVRVVAEQVVVDQGTVVREVYFPIDAQFANLVRYPDGSAIETAVIGNEGVTGLAPFMADRPCAWEIGCRAGGEAYVASAAALRTLSADRPRLMLRLLNLTDLYQSQAAIAAACNALHSAPERIARWILTARDLSPNETLTFRQEELARLIGARRSTVSEAASELKRRKVISYARGVIQITDRAGLEAAACACYAMLKPRLDAVHGPGPAGNVGSQT